MFNYAGLFNWTNNCRNSSSPDIRQSHAFFMLETGSGQDRVLHGVIGTHVDDGVLWRRSILS